MQCSNCKAIFTIKYYLFKYKYNLTKILCRKCSIKKAKIEKYGSLEAAKKHKNESRKKTCLKKYGVEEYFKRKDLIQEAIIKKYGKAVDNISQIPEINNKIKQTKHSKTRDDWNKILQKRKETCKEKYGTEFATQSSEVKEKLKQTCLKKYGTEHPSQNKEIQQKQIQTCLQKYGVEYVSQLRETKEKSKQTKLERYGDKNYNNRNRAKQTTKKHFGVEIPTRSLAIQNKIKQTNLQKYGFERPTQNEVIKDKVRKTFKSHDTDFYNKLKEQRKVTCLKRYGVDSFSKTKQFRKNHRSLYYYDNISFDSFWELSFYIWAKDNSLNIKRCTKNFNYIFEGKEYCYFPDFEIEDNLYEIKGNQFLKEDGTWQNPFDHSQDALYEAKHQCALKNNIKILYSEDCKIYINYVNEHYNSEFFEELKQ